jgi:hypothetical protein
MAAEGAFFRPDRGEPVPGYVLFGPKPDRFTTSATGLEGASGIFIPDPRDEMATFAPFVGIVRNAALDDLADVPDQAPGPSRGLIGYEIVRP